MKQIRLLTAAMGPSKPLPPGTILSIPEDITLESASNLVRKGYAEDCAEEKVEAPPEEATAESQAVSADETESSITPTETPVDEAADDGGEAETEEEEEGKPLDEVLAEMDEPQLRKALDKREIAYSHNAKAPNLRKKLKAAIEAEQG